MNLSSWCAGASSALSVMSMIALSSCSRQAPPATQAALPPVAAEVKPPAPPPPTTTKQPTLVVELPPAAADLTARWLEQGWTPAVRARAHYGSQGSGTFSVPYEWFVALEQPSSTPSVESKLLIEASYLSRFGFIVIDEDAEQNPDRLPIGFARANPFKSLFSDNLDAHPETGAEYTGVGFTCAACHTGQLEYGDTRLLIDGGSATTDLGAFRSALAGALQGLGDASRAQRFVARVLSSDATPTHRQKLQEQLMNFSQTAAKEQAAMLAAAQARMPPGQKPIIEGFFRLDALARIGNEIFWLDQRRSLGVTGSELDANYALPSAPVSLPAIWDAPWFDWVQYNGSIMQPMFRNFAEALGVGAQIDLAAEPSRQLRSTVDVRGLHQLEADLAGAPPFPKRAFQGLRSPRWPEDVLGKIDRKLAARGATLYAKHCQSCHLPPPGSSAFWSTKYWKQDPGAARSAPRYLSLGLVPLEKIGTDPAQAVNMRDRTIQLPPALGGKTVRYGEALTSLEGAIDKSYDQLALPPSERAAFSGGRKNLVRAEPAYRPRPLNGVWATPPFLHNGSVPTLYELLSPARERKRTFYVGSRVFDPKLIGFDHDPGPGLSALDTGIPGNHNTGHQFASGEDEGVLGPELSHAERMALIEFCKTL